MKSKLVVLVFCVIAVFITLNRGEWKASKCIVWDGTGYYMYLPAFITEHDPWQLKFYENIDQKYEPSGSVHQYGLHTHPETGRKTIKYAMGVALFELPLFCVAHVITKTFTNYPADGYSAVYQLAVALSTIMWVVFGLLFLRRFLLHHFKESTVWVCLIIVCLGTNLYFYIAFYPGWSHPYSFFLFALMLYLTECWYRTERKRFVLAMAVALGLTVLTRPTNIIIALIPLLYGIDSLKSLQSRGLFFLKQIKPLLGAVFVFSAIVFVQMCYWKYTSDHWIFDSYDNQVFDFKHPSFYKGLFSYRKGWFLYTPIALVMLCGLIPLYRNHQKIFTATIIYLLLQIYIVFSWKIWHYDGCFSCRPMVETVAVLAIPAAALIEWIQDQKMRFVKLGFATLFIALIGLNLFQSYQYSLGIIHFDRMTKAYYWRVFGKLKIKDEDKKLLRPASEDKFAD